MEIERHRIPAREVLLSELWDRDPDAPDGPNAFHRFRLRLMPLIEEVLATGKGYDETLAILVEKLGLHEPLPLWGPTQIHNE